MNTERQMMCLDVGEEIKTQQVRLLDVFVVGPLMVWGGHALSQRNGFAGMALSLLGIGTVLYNGRNYHRIRRRLRERAR